MQPLTARAQDGEELIDRQPEDCIWLTRLDRTEVIDDRTIIFHMRDDSIYLNHLTRECPGLKREERFMYSPTSNRLCDIDAVTVLERWGFGLTRGFTCSLGKFHPITEVELEDIKLAEEQEGDKGGFEVVPVDPSKIDDAAKAGDQSESEPKDETETQEASPAKD